MASLQFASPRFDQFREAQVPFADATFTLVRERSEVIPFPRAAEAPAIDLRFTDLEWTVVRLAKRDGLESIRATGLVRKLPRVLFGHRIAQSLADDRLETLRRVSVVAWRFGREMPVGAKEALAASGFLQGHAELLFDFVASTVARRRGAVTRLADAIAFFSLRRVRFDARRVDASPT